MKNFTGIAASVVGVVLLNGNVLAQESPAAKKHEDVAYYYVVYTKYKIGKAEEAKGIINDHFLPTDQAIERDVIAFDSLTGEWDQVVYFPLSEGPSELAWQLSPTEEKWWQAFAKQAGGMEQAEEIWQQFLGLVEASQSDLVMTRWEKPSSGD